MPIRTVDLSAPISSVDAPESDALAVSIDYIDHRAGAREIEKRFGVPAELLRDGEGRSRETLTIGTHNATHVDAPYHFNSHVDDAPAETIDVLALDQFFAPSVVVDMRHKADGNAVDISDFAEELATVGHDLDPDDIVATHTTTSVAN